LRKNNIVLDVLLPEMLQAGKDFALDDKNAVVPACHGADAVSCSVERHGIPGSIRGICRRMPANMI
jgi:hypothetical protein